MIPEFPSFKRLEISDKSDVETFTSRFDSYSDFNFISLWSWDIKEEVQLSQLYGNLIVRFNDYLSGEPFYSFLGSSELSETARRISEYAKTHDVSPVLRLVPDIVAQQLPRTEFDISEDPDNFDYILSLERLKPHDGTERKLSSRRKLINKLKQQEDFRVEPIHASAPLISKQILALSLEWEAQRGIKGQDAKHLYQALVRALAMNDTNENIFSLGAFLDDRLVGYSVNEVAENGYAIGHFQQADLTASVGVYAFLMEEAAVHLCERGSVYMNLEQDLGLEGLKTWKKSYHPVGYLKKYTVSPVDK